MSKSKKAQKYRMSNGNEERITNIVLAERLTGISRKLDETKEEFKSIFQTHATEDSARFADSRRTMAELKESTDKKHEQNTSRFDGIERWQIHNRSLILGAVSVIGVFWTVITICLGLLIAASTLVATIYLTQKNQSAVSMQGKSADEVSEILRRMEKK